MKKKSWFFWFVIIMGTGIFVITLADASHSTPLSQEGTRESQVIEL